MTSLALNIEKSQSFVPKLGIIVMAEESWEGSNVNLVTPAAAAAVAIPKENNK